MGDRVGLGWRPELAAGVFANLDRIDIVEIIADDFFDVPHKKLRAIRTLSTQVPVVLHGIGLGLASAVPVEPRRLERMARVVSAVEPEFWSEHLAFVRGGGREIGHLAAPPRTNATMEGAARNLETAARVVGTPPLMENVATLIDPPGSQLDEPSWIGRILESSRSDLLLDLHNLHANAVNFGFSPLDFLQRIPTARVGAVHLAGGRLVRPDPTEFCCGSAERLLDDHLHDVPDAVFGLLEEVAFRVPRPLTVILERDGNFPSMKCLLDQLDRARGSVQMGRLRRAEAARKPAA